MDTLAKSALTYPKIFTGVLALAVGLVFIFGCFSASLLQGGHGGSMIDGGIPLVSDMTLQHHNDAHMVSLSLPVQNPLLQMVKYIPHVLLAVFTLIAFLFLGLYLNWLAPNKEQMLPLYNHVTLLFRKGILNPKTY